MDEAIRQYLMEGERAGGRYRLATPRSAPQGTAGAELGRAVGSSLEFMDHREYQPGDDLRHIDWSAYARTDRLTVKLYRQELCPHLDVVLDGSRSMALAGTDKLRATAGLAAALATAAANAGYSHCAWLAGAGCRRVDNGSAPPSAWEGLDFDAAVSPPEAFAALPPAWRPRAIRALLSDLLWLGEPEELLGLLADRAAAVFVVQVLARDDMAPPRRGNLRLVDSETRQIQEVFLDAAAQRRYARDLQRHQQHWLRACKACGAVFVPLVAEEVCAAWDLSALVAAGALRV